MTGLVWRDALTLSPAQWAGLLVFPGLSLWWRRQDSTLRQDVTLMSACLLTLFVLFADTQIGIDLRTTWYVLPRLQEQVWISELGFTPYLKFQPPLWAWWLRQCPIYLCQQAWTVVGSALFLSLAYRHGGKRLASVFLACPLFLLLSVLPTNDGWAMVAVSVAVVSRQRPVCAGMALCLACSLKYTVYALLPILLWVMPVPVCLTGIWIAAYWTGLLSLNAFWPGEQWRYLLHAFSFGQVSYYVHAAQEAGRTGNMPVVWRLLGAAWWRWHTLGASCMAAAPWYLFPLYLYIRSFPVALTFFGLCLGYGNVKYLSLLFPLVLLSASRHTRKVSV